MYLETGVLAFSFLTDFVLDYEETYTNAVVNSNHPDPGVVKVKDGTFVVVLLLRMKTGLSQYLLQQTCTPGLNKATYFLKVSSELTKQLAYFYIGTNW